MEEKRLLLAESTALRQYTQKSLDDELLQLARIAGTGELTTPQQPKSPEQPGDFSLEDILNSGDLWVSTGQRLPNVDSQLEQRARWQESGSPLGYLAARTEVSLVTGCWSDPTLWRDDKGYAYVRKPDELGVKRDSKFGARGHKLAYILKMRQYDPSFDLPPRTSIDHKCRFTGCCNPNHLETVTAKENNIRQRLALPIEKALTLGQLMVGPTGCKWLDVKVITSPAENTGLVVNTAAGPYQIIKLDEDPLIIHGRRLDDDLLSLIRQPSQRKASRPSRAKKQIIHDGQEALSI